MLTPVRKFAALGLALALAVPAASLSVAEAGERWRHGGVHHHHYHYRGSGSSAFTAGVVGLAAGAVIGSAIAQPRYYAPPPPPPRVVYYEPAPVYYLPAPWTPDWYAYCASKYPSFDTRSGTYVSWGGVRRFCR
jgi:hypothetical protein